MPDLELPAERCEASPPHHQFHESRGYLQARLSALSKLLREEAPRSLTLAEYAALVPRRTPPGCPQNKIRGVILRTLNEAGFTVNGKRCT
jgi:hypothetical protein